MKACTDAAVRSALVDAPPLDEFELPESAAAHEPPEARGLRRDQVRLMVSRVSEGTVAHARFADLPRFLEPGDLLVVNASATIPAALRGARRLHSDVPGGGEGREIARAEISAPEDVLLHLSSPLDGFWVVELRRVTSEGHSPLLDAEPGESIELPAGGKARLVRPHETSAGHANPNWSGRTRLWITQLELPNPTMEYLSRYGAPIRYSYVPRPWPLADYQTVFAIEPGSAEMPSAGRPFTKDVLRALGHVGVGLASIVLHTGVSSLDAGEPPYPERFRVSREAAAAVNRTRAAGRRVIAVGTTVVRALESAASDDGTVRNTEGWTDLVVTPERTLLAVDGLVTGLHAPKASHLELLESFAHADHLSAAYAEAVRLGYRWHEFGDSHLILP